LGGFPPLEKVLAFLGVSWGGRFVGKKIAISRIKKKDRPAFVFVCFVFDLWRLIAGKVVPYLPPAPALASSQPPATSVFDVLIGM
jgi:hypothetical protein